MPMMRDKVNRLMKIIAIQACLTLCVFAQVEICPAASQLEVYIPLEGDNDLFEFSIWSGPASDHRATGIALQKGPQGWQGFFISKSINLPLHPKDGDWEQWIQELDDLQLFDLEGDARLPYPSCVTTKLLSDGELVATEQWPTGYHYLVCVEYNRYGDKRSFSYTLPWQCDIAKDCPEFEHACKMKKVVTYIYGHTQVLKEGQLYALNAIEELERVKRNGH